MSTHLRILAFGTVSGLIWSVVAGTLDELFRSPVETTTAIIPGILAGIFTSFAVALPLKRFGGRSVVPVGLVSLPIGAFVFGVFISVVRYIAREFTGEGYRFVEPDFSPLVIGAQYALLSMISVLASVLFPLAVFTTFLLRSVIFKGPHHGEGA